MTISTSRAGQLYYVSLLGRLIPYHSSKISISCIPFDTPWMRNFDSEVANLIPANSRPAMPPSPLQPSSQSQAAEPSSQPAAAPLRGGSSAEAARGCRLAQLWDQQRFTGLH